MSFLTSFSRWLGRSAVLADRTGDQLVLPSSTIVENTQTLGPDSALQLATLYRCVDLLSKTVATLPMRPVRKSSPEGQRFGGYCTMPRMAA
jgi:hypothetical protein